MHNKKAFDVSIKELIYLVLLVIAVIILWPKISYIVHNWIKTAPEDVERQFDALIPDIAAVENGKSKIVPFAVNKDEEIYKLATHKACTEKENPQDNNCGRKAKLCLVHVEGKQNTLCKEYEDGNFEKNFEYYPKGTTITISKNNDGLVDFVT